MKSTRVFFGILAVSLAVGCLTLLPQAGGATTDTNTPAKGKAGVAATNTVKAPLPIPVSVFDVAATPTKNPFFPLSLRQPVPATNNTAAPSISASSFTLMALSGSADSRLAMINRRTLSVGESVDLTMATGAHVKIRLLKINDASVVIRVVTPPQPDLIELSLSQGDAKGSHFYLGTSVGNSDLAHSGNQ